MGGLGVRKIAVVTTSRADYSIYRATLRAILDHPSLELALIVTGTHMETEHGLTRQQIEADAIPIAYAFPCLDKDDSPAGTARSMARALEGFASAFASLEPDVVVVLGDRFEMHSAAAAALPFRVPVAHIHGGELTLGAYDDAFRHSLTKLAHLHFPATDNSARRIAQMGEESWRITVSGAPGLDEFTTIPHLDREILSERVGIDLTESPILATWHPTTLESMPQLDQVKIFLEALASRPEPIVLSMPNADTGSREVRGCIEAFVAGHPNRVLQPSFGPEVYVNLMRIGVAMAGNSSSGILEAPSFGLPVVNVGRRQEGRERATNVIDVPLDTTAIIQALAQATEPTFRERLLGRPSPFRQGRPASEIIRERLALIELGPELLLKRWNEGGSLS